MKTVVFHIDTHPIEPKLLKMLGIYSTTRVDRGRLGSVISRLVKAGFTQIDSRTEASPYNFEMIITTFHITRAKDDNGVYIK